MRTKKRKRELQIMRICRALTEGLVRGPPTPPCTPQPYLTPTDLPTSQTFPPPALLFQREAKPDLEPASPRAPPPPLSWAAGRALDGDPTWHPTLMPA